MDEFSRAFFYPTKEQWAIQRANYWWEQCCIKHSINFPAPKVEFSWRMTSCAGMAYSKFRTVVYNRNDSHIVLSGHFLHKVDSAEFDPTIAHEICHIFANCYYKQDCKHGYLWQKTMRELGLSPDRCHNYETEKKSRRDYIVNCRCGIKMKFSSTIVRRIGQGKVYRCAKCKTPIEKSNIEQVK